MNGKDKWLRVVVVAVAVLATVGVVVVVFNRTRPGDSAVERPAPATPAPQAPRVRPASVAGLFYPAEPVKLAQTIDQLLSQAKVQPINDLRALIVPHAGYEFSGAVAATGYRLLLERDVRTVILLAPSHTAVFHGASVAAADVYQTPLGSVPISPLAATLARQAPFVPEPRLLAARPGWWTQSPRQAPPMGQDTPETWEHAGEVQVPFLQRTLRQFALVSVIFGQVGPEDAAWTLARHLDDKTLIVASSDLSHDQSYDEARRMDDRCITAVCNLDTDAAKTQSACGLGPILTLMHLAKQQGWQAKVLEYRNSGDVTGKDSRIVGYAAIAFYGAVKAAPAAPAGYSPEERRFLLNLARRTLKEIVTRQRLPEVDAAGLPARYTPVRACFVTLNKKKQLRGCIGHLEAREPLYKAVMDNTQAAALYDSRFLPVRAAELDDIEIEISVLTDAKPLQFATGEELLQQLQPHRDGVILQIGNARATYLPQVWEQIPGKEGFLNQLAQKAGAPPQAWRAPGTKVWTYQVESFHE